MLVKAFELPRIGCQSLEVACLLENQPGTMKALKPAADHSLEHDAIAAMRYPRPHKRTAVHEASEHS